MVSVSQAFKTAVANGNPQRIVFQFDSGTIISNEDVDVESGVDFHETFCSETDLTIGLCPSSELSFNLLNDDGHWTNFLFGAFRAYIGVRLSVTANSSASVKRPTISISGTSMTVNGNGKLETYELCPLGKFIAPRPAVVQKVMIDVQANDQMCLFDADMPSDSALGGITYPVRADTLLRKICAYVGVTCESYSFLNNSLTISARPDTFDSCSMRDVVSLIAEAAGSTARFNRSGNLELVWFNTTSQTYDEGNYTSIEPTWYAVPKVNKLTIRNDDSTAESIIGSGSNAYMIQNNPFLRVDDSNT